MAAAQHLLGRQGAPKKGKIHTTLHRKGTAQLLRRPGDSTKPVEIEEEDDFELKLALLVDDLGMARKMTKRALSRTGFQVTCAADGRAAVELCKSNRYYLILMDVQLPILNGVDASKAIRAWERDNLPPGEHAILFGLTGSCSIDDLKRYVEAGMDGCIQKGCVVGRAVHEAVVLHEANPEEFVFIDKHHVQRALDGSEAQPRDAGPADAETRAVRAGSGATAPPPAAAASAAAAAEAARKSPVVIAPAAASSAMAALDADGIASDNVDPLARALKNRLRVRAHQIQRSEAAGGKAPAAARAMHPRGHEEKRFKHQALLVDDVAITRKVTERGLQRAGYGCESAVNGLEAVAKAEKSVFTVILMDVNLPELDGVEATRQIRTLEKAAARKHAIIIGLTSSTQHEDLERYAAAGMDGCIEKGCVVHRATHEALAMIRTNREEFVFIDSTNAQSYPLISTADDGRTILKPAEADEDVE